MAPTHVQFLEVFPFPEPCSRRAAILAAGSAGILARRTLGRQGCRPNRQAGSLPYVPCQVYGLNLRPIFSLSMNLLRVADPRSGARLCEAQRFMAPTHVQSLEVFALHEPGFGRDIALRLPR